MTKWIQIEFIQSKWIQIEAWLYHFIGCEKRWVLPTMCVWAKSFDHIGTQNVCDLSYFFPRMNCSWEQKDSNPLQKVLMIWFEVEKLDL